MSTPLALRPTARSERGRADRARRVVSAPLVSTDCPRPVQGAHSKVRVLVSGSTVGGEVSMTATAQKRSRSLN